MDAQRQSYLMSLSAEGLSDFELKLRTRLSNTRKDIKESMESLKITRETLKELEWIKAERARIDMAGNVVEFPAPNTPSAEEATPKKRKTTRY